MSFVWRVAFSVAALSASSVSANDRSSFVSPLFDGHSLAGWTAENDIVTVVEDNVLRSTAGDGWLRSDHEYADFRLEIEWRALQSAKSDSGIFLRAGRDGKPFPARAMQVNLLEGQAGALIGFHGPPNQSLIKPPGEWNRFVITVVKDTVTLEVNGEPGYSVAGVPTSPGHIGLQVEVPAGGAFEFRNILVTELDFVGLFNGKDLSGWEGAGAPAESCWKVVDGRLTCTGEKGPWLRTLKEYGDFNLRLEYLVEDGGNSGVYVRVPADGTHHRDSDEEPPAGFEVQVLDDHAEKYAKLKPYQYSASAYAIAPATKNVARPAGQWNTLEINCSGHSVRTRHNGVIVVDADPERFPRLLLRKTSGFLGLQNHSTTVQFRRLRIGPSLPAETGQPK